MRKSKYKDKVYLGFTCKDCGVNTLDNQEYYMVENDVWLEAHNIAPIENEREYWARSSNYEGMLCISCLEDRIGRKLVSEDFPDYPINNWHGKSEKLLNRLGASETNTH